MKNSIYFILIASMLFLGCSKSDEDLNSDLINSQLKSASETPLNAKSPNSNPSPNSDPIKVTTAHSWTEYNEFEFWCGDNLIDYLKGDFDVHCVMQYENDELLFMNMTFDGSFIGENTGEVFKFKNITKYDASSKKFYQEHFNVVGDMGSHLKFSFTVSTEEPWFVINKAECGE